MLAAHGVDVMIDDAGGYTPTPVLSHAILSHNRGRESGFADGIVITPSHNPPEDGGFKYNPPHGGPAEGEITKWVEDRANAILEAGLAGTGLSFRSKNYPTYVLRHRNGEIWIDPQAADTTFVQSADALLAGQDSSAYPWLKIGRAHV